MIVALKHYYFLSTRPFIRKIKDPAVGTVTYTIVIIKIAVVHKMRCDIVRHTRSD